MVGWQRQAFAASGRRQSRRQMCIVMRYWKVDLMTDCRHAGLGNWNRLKTYEVCGEQIERQAGHCRRKVTASNRHSLARNSRIAMQVLKALASFTFFFCNGPDVLTRFRLFITSVLRLIGRGVPCSFVKSPHALHKTLPSSSRRQSGVVEVEQL